jgi:uncharacterized protein
VIAVVSDTSPIRALSHLGRLNLLSTLFEKVYVPTAVVEELEDPTAELPPLKGAYLPFVEIRNPTDQARVKHFLQTLDRGESEALALALEVRAASILVDELAARQEAERVGLTPVGVLGILIRGKELGEVPLIAPEIDRLQHEINFFISPQLRRDVLRLANE